jgi:Lon protease-like protein
MLSVPGFAFDVDIGELSGLPLMPIDGRPLLPGAFLSLEATEPLDRALIEYALAHTDGLVVVALVRDITSFDEDNPWLEPVASLARIFPDVERHDELMLVQCGGVGRVRIITEHDAPDAAFSLVDVEPLATQPGDPGRMAAAIQLFSAALPGLRAVSPEFCEHLINLLKHYDQQPGIMADLLTSLSVVQDEERDRAFQRAMLCELDDASRMEQSAAQFIELLALLQRAQEHASPLRN